MKQKVIEILGVFLKRNEGYVVYAYLKNLAGKILVNYSMYEWNVEEKDEYLKDEYLKIVWYEELHSDYVAVYYPDVVKCYEEIDEFGQRSIHILFFNGLQLDFECCGECVEK